MKVPDIEIPYQKEKTRRYIVLEKIPGLLSWTILFLPFILSFVNPTLTVFFIIAYLLIWFVKAVGLNIRSLQGWHTMREHQSYKWEDMLRELETGTVSPHAKRPKWHYENVAKLQKTPPHLQPSEVIHAVIIATYNENREVVEPTIQTVLNSNFDKKKVIFVLAYEERGGPAVAAQSKELVQQYKEQFMHAMAVEHPDGIPGEVKGKGGNITYAARQLETYLREQDIDPNRVQVTTLDADNRPHENYLAALTYTFVLTHDPLHASYQPIPMFTNNIWDAPAPMRVIATGNSFWMVVSALRPHLLRNFSAHAQGMQALIDTDYWSTRTIVEDGHQFWRTYFRYDGNHKVYPIFVPIYQDAVMAATFRKTLKAQFLQLRRWAWGCSDIPYVLEVGFFRKNKVNKVDLVMKFSRLLEGHISWATAPFMLLFSALIPAFFNPDNIAANQLPLIASRIQQIAMAGILVTLFLSLKALPPKPARYKKHRTLFMVLQWIYLPITSIAYNAVSGLYSQTRLLFGRYMDVFVVTEKAVATDGKGIVTSHTDTTNKDQAG